MDDAAIAVVRANSAAFSAQDVDEMLRWYAPDAVVADQRHGGLLGSFSGHDELRSFYLGIFGMATTMYEHLEVLAAAHGVVVADCELRGKLVADAGGREMTAPYGMVITLREGLIVRLEIYGDGREALEVSDLRSGV